MYVAVKLISLQRNLARVVLFPVVWYGIFFGSGIDHGGSFGSVGFDLGGEGQLY